MNKKSNELLKIKHTILESWKLVKGTKFAIWLTILPIFALALVFHFMIFKTPQANSSQYLYIFIVEIVTYALFAPFVAGGTLIAIQRYRGESISFKSGFIYFKYWPQLAIANSIILLVMHFLVYFGWLIVKYYHPVALIPAIFTAWIPFIFVIFSYIFYLISVFALPLIIDKNINFYCAFKEAYKQIFPYLHKVITLYLVSFLFVCLFCTLFAFLLHGSLEIFGVIGLAVFVCWGLPYMTMLSGNIYCQIFDKKIL